MVESSEESTHILQISELSELCLPLCHSLSLSFSSSPSPPLINWMLLGVYYREKADLVVLFKNL